MMAARFYAPGDVRYESVSLNPPTPGEMVMEVKTALTCGTDLKAYRRGHPVLLKNFPALFGHECAGEVTAVGEGVRRFKPGDRVVAANSAPCGSCFFCLKKQPNLCESLDLLNGAYAQYLTVPARIAEKNTLQIPSHVSFEKAAFCEPLAVCLRGIEACHIQPGDKVCVIGTGTVGQFMIRLAKLKGATVVALGRNAMKRQLAQTFGQADTVLEISAESIRPPYGFDVVIEAVGQPSTWALALDLVRKGGVVNWFGGCAAGTTVEVDTRRMHYDELTLISLFHHTPEYFAKALDMIAEGVLDPTPLITEHKPMSQVVEALEQVEAGKALKVALIPEL
jgi:L-iditol 2-dehydrogenase